ncbi:hypothetical protein GCM10023063_19260 [Arthrobacter methylotrophus]|uniref:Uncharacterized protein n=1 Tax=Arthrobacter methylotrophus TaxID=121291 RepID=A0ABV5UPZ1_9MICC
MSGGSFNYACEFGTLKDLWVEKSGIEGIADALRERGHDAAAVETEALLSELAVFEDYIRPAPNDFAASGKRRNGLSPATGRMPISPPTSTASSPHRRSQTPCVSKLPPEGS